MIRKNVFFTVVIVAMMACNGNAKKTSDINGTDNGQATAPTETAQTAPPAITIGSEWQNGTEWFHVRADGDVLVFAGGTLHEGGAVFGLKAKGNNLYNVVPAKWSDDPENGDATSLSAQGLYGENSNLLTAELKNFNGQQVIVIRHKTKGVRQVLIKAEGRGMEALDKAQCAYIAQWLAGNWCSRNGERYVMRTDQSYAFPSGNGKYKIEYEYEMPSNIITLNDGTHWGVETKDEGLSLTQVVGDSENETWEKLQGGKVIHLLRMADDERHWLYAFASEQPLTFGMLGSYSKDALRIMRNEIMARHGYRFNSPDLQQRFSRIEGYKPVGDNSQVHLTPLEQLNVEIIKAEEERSEDDW